MLKIHTILKFIYCQSSCIFIKTHIIAIRNYGNDVYQWDAKNLTTVRIFNL